MDANKMISRMEMKLIEEGKTKSELFRKTNISSAAISQWRTGKTTPRIQSVRKIADFLGVSYEWLVAGVEGNEKKEAPSLPKEEERLDSPAVWATAWEQASPELRRAALAVLRSAVHSAESDDPPVSSNP